VGRSWLARGWQPDPPPERKHCHHRLSILIPWLADLHHAQGCGAKQSSARHSSVRSISSSRSTENQQVPSQLMVTALTISRPDDECSNLRRQQPLLLPGCAARPGQSL